MRQTIVAVIAAIGGEAAGLPGAASRMSVLDQMSAGRLLRQQREQLTGRWQGPLAGAAGSVMLCVSLGSISDDLATELLVRILRDKKLDARHLSLEDLRQTPPPEALPGSVVDGLSGQRLPERGRARGPSRRPRTAPPFSGRRAW